MKFNPTILGLLSMALIAISCTKEKDDPIIPNEEELITTLTYTLISADNTDTVELKFEDLDGQGGALPIITGGVLKANTNYDGALLLLNEQLTPAENITLEIVTEGEFHQFFYKNQLGLDATVDYNDLDVLGKPIGVNTILHAKSVSAGELVITLRHEPNKSAPGVASGDMTNAGGETDIEITFDVEIQ